jgi:hypothetical protein
VELLVQDYVDTTRPFEASFEAMSHPYLINAGGKDDLGGGKLVDITLSEQDLKVAFEARRLIHQLTSLLLVLTVAHW